MKRAGKSFGTCVRLSAADCYDRVKRASGWHMGYPIKQEIAREAGWPVLDKLSQVREWPLMVEIINT
jgi:hypothetical protein